MLNVYQEMDEGQSIRDQWPETIHPQFVSLVRRFPAVLPPAGTLDPAGLRKVGASNRVIRWAEGGVPLQWARGVAPPLFIGRNSSTVMLESEFVDKRVSEYLQAGAIKVINKRDVRCSMPIKVVVSGASGKKRLIWVGCFVNEYLPCPSFTYEKLEEFMCVLKPGGWLGKVDASAGYHTIRIDVRYTCFLCFEWKKTFYAFQVLPFGLAIAPWVYTIIMRDLTRYWRSCGMVMIHYLDDVGWASDSVGAWWEGSKRIVEVLQMCGFWLGLDKCLLFPSKEMELLGFILNVQDMTIALPHRRIEQIQALGEDMMKADLVPLSDLRSFCGKIVSAEKALWTCRVYLRELFTTLRKFAWVEPLDATTFVLKLKDFQLDEIDFWIKAIEQAGKPMCFSETHIGFSFDASDWGYGGVGLGQEIVGGFSPFEKSQSSTFRELTALFMVFLHLKDGLLVRTRQPAPGTINHIPKLRPVTDNQNVARIMRYGSKVKLINDVARKLWDWAAEAGFKWDVVWVPRHLNTEADRLSKVASFDVVLNCHAFHLCYLNKRVRPTAQAFCTRVGVLPQIANFWHPTDAGAIKIDFLSHTWGMACIPLATPDWDIIHAVLAHIRDIEKRAIVVCPLWRNKGWSPLLKELTEWKFIPPGDIPMFVVAGNGNPSKYPAKLHFKSGFFMVNGFSHSPRTQAEGSREAHSSRGKPS